MKNSGKSSKPIIAAHSTKKNGNQPAPPANGKSTRARVSRSSSEKLRLLVLERIHDGILAFDSEMNHVYVNERAGELLGRDPKTLVGKNFSEAYPESTGTAFADACQRAFETQTVVPFDGYFPATDSWLEGRIYPSSDGLSVLLSDRVQTRSEDTGDVTENQRYEKEIHEVSQFPMQNPNPVMRFTRDGELLFANPASTPILESWKGQTAEQIPNELQELLPNVLDSGSNKELEFKNAGKTYAALLVPVQEAGYVNLYFNDVSERKQAQDSVQAIIHQATTGMTQTGLDGKFVFVNQAFCDMLGYSETELLGRTIWEISHPADIAKNQRLFERLIKDGDSYQLEKRLLRRNGTILWVSVGASPLRDSEGNIHAAVSIIVDITRRKRAEESLLDSARRTLYLASLSDTIRPLSSPSQIEVEATRILGLHLKASRVAYAEMRGDGTVVINNSYVTDAAKLAGEFNIDQFFPQGMLSKFWAGRSVVTTGTNDEPLLAWKESVPVQSQIVIPLIRNGEPVAALFVQQTFARAWTNEEIHLVEETAERMQAAIERARAERDLRESESRFRILSNTVPSMVWSTAPDGTIQYLNEHWHHYTGLNEEESISNWAELALHPDDYEQCLAAWNHALATVPEEYLYEVRYRRYDGEYRWFQSRATPARDENGNVIAWHGVSTDIHDRVEREAELQQVINHTPFMFTRCSRDLRYRFVSQAYAEMVGRTPQEMAGKPIVEIMGEDGLKVIQPYVEQVLQGKRVEYEAEVSFQNVGTPFLHVIYMPDYDGQGNVIGWFASITDMTERQHMENELRESERKFSLIYENLPFAAALSKPENGVLVDVNREFEKVFGYSKQDVIGKTSLELGINPDEESRARLLAEIQTKGSARDHELKLQTKTNGLRDFSINLDLVTINGERYILQTTQDITERIKAEEWEQLYSQNLVAAAEANAKFRTFFDQGSYFAGVMTLDGTLIEANRLCLDFCGFTREEVIGKKFWDCGWWNPSPVLMDMVRKGTQEAAGGKLFRAESTYFVADGSERVVDLIIAPIKDETGQILFLAPTGTDITERKRIEEALRFENERFMKFIDSNIIGIVIGDARGKVLLANDYYLNLLGVTRQDFMEDKVDWKNFTPPEWLPADEKAIREMRERGICEPYEKEYVRTDGTRVPVYIADAMLPGPGEEIVAFVLDLTERKRAEEALRASEEKYRRIIETANEGIWEIDKDTRTVFVNPRVAEMLGYTPEEMIGHTVFDFLLPEDNVEGENRLERAKSGIAARSAEFRYRRKNGSILWTLASTKPQFDGQGNFIGSVAMLTDISERKQFERSLIEYARQQTAVYELADQFNRMHTFEQMYEASLDAIHKAVLCDRASILLFDDKDVMRFVAWHGLSDEYRKATEGHSPWKADEKNPIPIAVNDIRTADLSDSLKAVIAREGIGSLAFIPIVFQGRLIGKFMVYFNAPHTFRETELDISLTISRQLAAAIDRKRAEQALRESQERFVSFMQYLPGLAWIKDREGRYIFANASAEKAFNTQLQDLYGRTDQEIFSAETAELFQRNDEQALREEGGVQVVETLPQTDGVVHYSLVTKFPIPGPDGRTALIGGTAFDITERVHMEDALREARQQAEETTDRIARLQEVTASLAATSNPMQLAEFILEQGIHATGASAGILVELINEGKDLKTIAVVGNSSGAFDRDPVPLSAPTPISDCIRTRQAIWIESQEHFTAQYSALAETNQAFGNQATVALPLVIGDHVLGGLAFSFDEPHEFLLEERGFFLAVAQQCAQGLQRARAEEALRESEERYRAIVNQATAGIIRKDAHGKLLFVNDAFCQMLGYQDTELIDKTIWQLTYEEDIAESEQRFRRLIVEGIPFQLEKRLLRRDGSILWVAVSVSPVLDAAGKSRSAVSVYVDITERKQAENRLVLLGEISEYIRNLEDPKELMSTVANAVGKHLHVKRALFNEIDVENDIEIVHSDFHDGVESVAGVHKITDYSNITSQEMEKGKTVVNTDSKLDRRTAKDYERTYLSTGERAYIAVPLMREERWVASLWVSDDKPRVWNLEEISLLETIAERTWIAIEKLRINVALRELNAQLEEHVKERTAELQAANKFLSESEAISRLIMESMPDAIVITDKDGFIVHCNTQVETLFGFAPQEVLGQQVEMLIPLRFHQSHIRERLNYNQQRHRRSMGLGRELFGRRKDGSEFPVDITLSPISNNTTWDVMVTIRDNTEQKQAQEALRSNEEKLRKVFEILPVGISFLGNDGQILDMNSALSHILGLSKSELIKGNHKPRLYIRTDGSPMPVSEIASTRAKVEQKTIYNVETGIVKENGETIWTSVNAAPVDVADVDVVVATIDITERKKAEDALHQNRERLRTLSRRLVEVQEEERQALAHELHDRVGQNLAALNLNLNILRSQLTNEVLQIVGTRLDDSVTLVNQILTITRNVMADLRSNVLDDYGLESALREFSEQFTQRTGVEVVSDKSVTAIPRLDPSIEMTMLRIAQEALTNVARHAQASKATISVKIDDEAVYMSIQDDGIGILSWQKANQPGSHGLRIIRERAEAFGGSLSVNSTYKKGTRIEVKIPLSSASSHKVSRERRS